MNYYVMVSNGNIQIIPRWQKKLSTEFLTEKEYMDEAYKNFFDGEFMIPLSKFKIDRVPQTVAIFYGNKMYESLSDLVDVIYLSRSYNITEESAKQRIRNLAIKAMLKKTKLYGKEISYSFDFIDASNYTIIY